MPHIWHNTGVRFLLTGLLAVTMALAVAACAHPKAETLPEMPALDVPAAPERVIAPPPPEEPPAPAAPEQAAPAARPARPRPQQAPTSKVDPTSGAAAPPTAPAAPPAAGTLQTTSPANQAEVIRNVRDLLTRAQRDLKRVDYAALNADGKAQYDTARRFIDQAEQALKEQNLVFARTLADKAATLGRSLVSR